MWVNAIGRHSVVARKLWVSVDFFGKEKKFGCFSIVSCQNKKTVLKSLVRGTQNF